MSDGRDVGTGRAVPSDDAVDSLADGGASADEDEASASDRCLSRSGVPAEADVDASTAGESGRNASFADAICCRRDASSLSSSGVGKVARSICADDAESAPAAGAEVDFVGDGAMAGVAEDVRGVVYVDGTDGGPEPVCGGWLVCGSD